MRARESRPENSKIGLDFRRLSLLVDAGNPALRRLQGAPAHCIADGIDAAGDQGRDRRVCVVNQQNPVDFR